MLYCRIERLHLADFFPLLLCPLCDCHKGTFIFEQPPNIYTQINIFSYCMQEKILWDQDKVHLEDGKLILCIETKWWMIPETAQISGILPII